MVTVVLKEFMFDCSVEPLEFKALVRLFIDTATEELFVVTVPFNEVIDEAREELLVLIELFSVVIELAKEEDAVTIVLFVVVSDAAIEELLVVMLLARPSILKAAELLFVVTVPLREVIEEFNEEEAVLNDELKFVNWTAIEELKVVKVL